MEGVRGSGIPSLFYPMSDHRIGMTVRRLASPVFSTQYYSNVVLLVLAFFPLYS